MQSTLFSVKFQSKQPYLDIYDHGMPQPSHLFESNGNCIATWCIRGYFSTVGNMTYFNDTAEKVYLLLNGSPTKANYLKADTKKNEIYPTLQHTTMKLHELKDFAGIDDIRYFKSKAIQIASNNDTEDEIFDKLRKEAYLLKKLGILTLEKLYLRLAEISTNPKKYKWKVPNVYEWTMKNYTGRVIRIETISRTENAIMQTKAASDVKYSRFKSYVQALESCNINYSINQLSSALQITWRTAKKYLNKHLQLSNLSLMSFIQRIRAKKQINYAGTAIGEILKRMNMTKEKLKELMIRIQSMTKDEIEDLRSKIMVSDANNQVKEFVMRAIHLKTANLFEAIESMKIINGDYDATD